MDDPCRQLGLTHVSVSFDRSSSGSNGCYHVNANLSKLDLPRLLQQIWHLHGLHLSGLLGIGSHPPCETYSRLSSGWGSRDNSQTGHHMPRVTYDPTTGQVSGNGLDAYHADNLMANCFQQLFGPPDSISFPCPDPFH
jgi:hypothetical protein